jgi:hypothetical protein
LRKYTPVLPSCCPFATWWQMRDGHADGWSKIRPVAGLS